ncbi:MAG: ParB/RepB/Spo0J family partition protein [Sulfitobacter sp.]
MSRKRPTFDIDMPDEAPVAAPRGPRASLIGAPRRGPMAAAISETSDAVGQRRAAEDAIRAENDALAHEHARLKRLGLVVELIALDAIVTTKLTRDRRVASIALDLDEMKASIREIGLSNPIRVEASGEGYELIQGLRRLTAYRALLEETGDQAFAHIPASLTQPGESTEALYRRMVDENLVRKDVSFAEMAMLAEAYAADPGTDVHQVDEAVKVLFKSASYQKRSYIRAFAELMERIDKYLKFPEVIPRNLGLSLRARMAETSDLTRALQQALKTASPRRTAEDELTILRRFAQKDAADIALGLEARALSPPPTSKTAPPQTRFTIPRPLGDARCTAADGRLEIRGPENFAAHSPTTLARAVAAFYDALG